METPELPLGVDDGVDEEAFDGSSGLELAVIAVSELFELDGVFAGDDVGLGLDTGLQSIETRDSFARGGARSGDAKGCERVFGDGGNEELDKMGATVTETVEALVLDLLEWLGRRERSYEETMEAWRTSCPRLTVWEDANELRLVWVENGNGRAVVRVTAAGVEWLRARGR